MNALFIGRFQPFHNGHLKVITEESKKYDEIIIGIGSSQYDNTTDNPFSADERKLMIVNSMSKENIKNFKIVLIPDIHNYPKWVKHVTSIVSDFDVVISNSDLTDRLFSEKNYTVEKTQIYCRDKYSGRQIRKKMINDEKWEDAVPSEVVKVIKNINGIERLKKLSKL